MSDVITPANIQTSTNDRVTMAAFQGLSANYIRPGPDVVIWTVQSFGANILNSKTVTRVEKALQ